jgi:glycosyltransferase involved in cell wall biosynthesis
MKFFVTTTIPSTLEFYSGQISLWNQYYEICAISSKKDLLSNFGKAENVNVQFIDMERDPSPLKDLKSLYSFIRLFIKEKPEIVHGGTPKAALLSMIAAWITHRPIRIYMCHGLRFEAFSGFKRKFLVFMEKLTCRCATDVICVSFGTREGLIKANCCTEGKAKVIGYGSPCGIDLSHYDNIPNFQKDTFRQSIGIKSTDFVFLFIGRIVRDKGVNELISSFIALSSKYDNIHLVVLGCYGVTNKVEDNSKNEIENNPRIHYMCQQNDIRPFMMASDVFVLPSYREGLSTVLVESGAMSLPAITCNVTGCNEIIEDGVNGLLIEPRNTDSLYNAMEKVYSNPQMLKDMGTNARKLVSERYEQSVVWNNYLQEYLKLKDRINHV